MDAGTKFVPVTVKRNPELPASTKPGLIDVSVGSEFEVELMVNSALPEFPPPGAGFVTLTSAVPDVAMSAALICACSCVALMKVVVTMLPFHSMAAPETKFCPLTLRVNAAAPAAVLFGLIELIAGAGLVIGGVGAGGALLPADPPPPHAAKRTSVTTNSSAGVVRAPRCCSSHRTPGPSEYAKQVLATRIGAGPISRRSLSLRKISKKWYL
jgi:hypothetical protein